MRRLVNVKVDYKLGERYMPYPGLRSNVECFSLWQNTTHKTHALQRCQCETPLSRSDPRFAGDSSYVSGNVSSPFVQCKERYCDCLSSGMFQEMSSALLIYNYCVSARVPIKNENILLPLSSLLVSSSMKESQKFIFSRNFPAFVACKTSKFATKETSLLLRQTPWRLMKLPINFISL